MAGPGESSVAVGSCVNASVEWSGLDGWSDPFRKIVTEGGVSGQRPVLVQESAEEYHFIFSTSSHGVSSGVLKELRRLENRRNELRKRDDRGRADLNRRKDELTTIETQLRSVYDAEARALGDQLKFKLNHGLV